ncbi:iron-siderophore ABC transporter substrate-binding protein [Leptolyngbya sp. FACHB-321]|uniref:ABC transporter substrate-binding protein n=1 Tax=Leptolyngbya sp. FACHB-321 TaxID=2692807 RepID=UPI00168702DF|nr:iron-siderophore ABC transporter substrate-binding protein [Leptolyngbya sp. FACHB-321]MBD2036886.1 iron-siderophore ABC transporter substrate-binding protein [Leptolyngbya sp. FACHB-321]
MKRLNWMRRILPLRQRGTCVASLLLPFALLLSACNPTASKANIRTLSTAASTTACRTIEHGMGKTCVPLNPKRVVVLNELDNVLALGVKPIGTVTLDRGFIDYLTDRTQGIEKVGTDSQPNLEKILLLKPDLIIGTTWDGKDIYDKLNRIAPTVFVDTNDYRSWKSWLKKTAEALGKTSEAEQLLQNYEQRVQQLQQALGDRSSNTQVSVVNFWQNNVRIYMKRSFSGVILQEVGLARPPVQNKDKLWERLSLELIPKMDGDVIFLLLGGHKESNLAQFKQHPLWSQLKPVQANKVYEVDSSIWIAGAGMIGANLILDDLSQHLVLEKP